MTRDEIVAAIVHVTIGYMSPEHAERHLGQLESGQDSCWCEGCLCCYRAKPSVLVAHAARWWRDAGDESRQRALQTAAAWKRALERAPDPLNQIGLFYPGLA